MEIYNGGGDLDIGESTGSQGEKVPDVDEESIGAYLLVNWDDDDGDGTLTNSGGTWTNDPVPDLTESLVVNEDNLAKIVPTIDPLPTQGFAILEVSKENDLVSLYPNSTKGPKIIFVDDSGSRKYFWNLSDSSQRNEFQTFMSNGIWMEGIKQSSAERDIDIRLSFENNGSEVCSDNAKATVIMMNLANVIGREVDFGPLAERGHVSIMGRFDGKCNRNDLLDASKYILYEADGGGDWLATEPGSREANMTHVTAKPGREFFGTQIPFITSFTEASKMQNNTEGYTNRLRIIYTARWLIDHTGTIEYTKFDAMKPNSGWNASLNTITNLRCDGFVEVCYEFNNINAWGKISGGGPFYSILLTSHQDDHNEWRFGDDPEDGEDDFWGWLMPITQIGYADTYISLHFPPFSGGMFDYTANTFRGTFWQSALSQQLLIQPTLP